MQPGLHRGSTATDNPAERLAATVLTLEDLLRDVLAGHVRAADHEASKWTAADAETLLDSILRGYPIGNLLLWQLQPGSCWVVDGQQRVHALTRVLAGAGLGADEFALHFDLEHEAFVRLPDRRHPSARHLPLTEVLDSERLLRWLRDHGDPADEIRALHFGKRLRDYPIPISVIHTTDEATVREIYRRLHTTGHPMRESAVFDAIATAQHGRRLHRLGELSDTLVDLDFGPLEERLLVAMMHALHGHDLDHPTADQLAALEQAVRAVILFLRQDAEIHQRTLVPDDLPLLALTILFDRFPRPHPRSRELLARWLWRHALAGPAPVPLPQTLATVRRGDETTVVQALLAMVPRSPPPSLALRPFDPDSVRGKIQLLALHDLGPRHLTHDGSVPSASGARDLLPNAPDEWQHDLANRILHPAISGGFRDAIINTEDPAVLASHAITPDIRDHLQRDDLRGFLAARADVLRAHQSAFLARHTRWEQSDRPPLAALEIGDDD